MYVCLVAGLDVKMIAMLGKLSMRNAGGCERKTWHGLVVRNGLVVRCDGWL